MRNLPPRSFRDPRLDFFRGLALVMIYINHVPGTPFEYLTSRNFGFSDAAEGFVFMSGLAAALAYGPGLASDRRWSTVVRIWGRSWTLYLVHLLTSAWAIAIVAGAALWFGGEALLTRNAFPPLVKEPLAFLVGIATLGHQVGYVNILPMYAVLMLAAPALIGLGQRRPGWLLAGSLALWALAGMFRLNLPNYPHAGGWFFNPFTWQLVFTFGILTGLALRGGRRFVPVRRVLILASAAWLAFSLVWVNSDTMLAGIGHMIWHLRQWGAPFWLVEFDKTYVAAPRLLHFLALAYVLSLPGLVPGIARSAAAAPLRLLGRNGLHVFALGTVLAILAQAVKELHAPALWLDVLLVPGGLALQLGFARLREWIRASTAPAPAAAPVVPVIITGAPQAARIRWAAKAAR